MYTVPLQVNRCAWRALRSLSLFLRKVQMIATSAEVTAVLSLVSWSVTFIGLCPAAKLAHTTQSGQSRDAAPLLSTKRPIQRAFRGPYRVHRIPPNVMLRPYAISVCAVACPIKPMPSPCECTHAAIRVHLSIIAM